MNRVFVYGSLMHGFHNHGFLSVDGARFMGDASTADEAFTMFDLGAFPGVIANGAASIRGEVYEVDDKTFASLDRLESYPEFYDRELIELDDGSRAWIYLLNVSADHLRLIDREVVSGDWDLHCHETKGGNQWNQS